MIAADPVNILLVDDQPAKLMTYETILRDLGENLIAAGSAREALEYILRKSIAVVLIDVCMPELDGFELAAMIRNHPRFQKTSIIFVSAIALTDLDRVKGYESGGVDYVPVPVVPELLRAKVRVFAELYRKTRQLEMLNAELERRVEERTAELAEANAQLEQRVEERTRERELALAQVHEMQKLESLGQLTGGVAHDFNNVLMAILGNLDLLAKRLPDGDPSKELVGDAIRAAERGATLTRHMLAFARRQELKPEAVDVALRIGAMAELLQRSLGPGIEIDMRFGDNLAPVLVDPNQLELAILNLALNARDAMPNGGRLVIAANRGPREGADTQDLASGEHICVSVSDTGVGMDDTTLKRAPEPFFTTKDVGKGTGLGLSMVYGLAAQSGGAARIFSRLGAGTTIELWVPLAQAGERPEPASAVAAASDTRRSYRILLVDDDALVMSASIAMLEELGHRVLSAPSATRALELIKRQVPVDLVITDHAMPGMSGTELAAELRSLRPGLPVLLATGYADLPGVSATSLPRLEKPFRLDKLAATIAQMMLLRAATSPAQSANADVPAV
jgi:signal transduction histidine kinase